jgi:hypothetical protein
MGVSWTKETISNSGTAGTSTAESLTIDSIKIDGTTIGHTDDTDLLTFASAALTLKGTLTVGIDGTGHDVKFFGDTSGNYMLYDESDDQLKLHCTAASKGLVITNSNTSGSGGPVLQLWRQSASSAADADEIGTIKFDGYDESGTSYQEYAKINAGIVDATSGSEKGGLYFNIMTENASANTMKTGMKLIGTATNDEVNAFISNGSLTIAKNLTITGATNGIIHTNRGAQTQADSATTAVTLNTTSGIITTYAATLATNTEVQFTLTNSTIQADSLVLVSMNDMNTDANSHILVTTNTIASGSCIINLFNCGSGTATATACHIHFLVINNS